MNATVRIFLWGEKAEVKKSPVSATMQGMQKAWPILFVGVLILIGGFLYLRQSSPLPEGGAASGVWAPAGSERIPKNAKKYTSERYGFSLYYPQDLVVEEFEEGNGAQTITFDSGEGTAGFQIFIVPYTEQSVTRERFSLDVPSGVFKDPINIVVGGVPATAFLSENDIMGETREVWVIHNGHLFEMTTYRSSDAWIAEIVNTWRFN